MHYWLQELLYVHAKCASYTLVSCPLKIAFVVIFQILTLNVLNNLHNGDCIVLAPYQECIIKFYSTARLILLLFVQQHLYYTIEMKSFNFDRILTKENRIEVNSKMIYKLLPVSKIQLIIVKRLRSEFKSMRLREVVFF